MGLLQPEVGLIFWMTLAFGLVFFLLAKFGFPIILKSIEERKDFISSSLTAAHEAEVKVAQVEKTCQTMQTQAETKRAEILQQASDQREQLMQQAREEAGQEREKLISEARQEAQTEKEAILRDAHSQVVMMALELTERLLRENLQDKASQTLLAERLLEEIHTENADEKCTQG